MKSKWITHKGERLFYSNYSNFGDDLDALAEEVRAADSVVCDQPKDSARVIVDVRGTTGTREAMDVFKQSSKRTQAHIHKMALLGISGVRKVLYQAVMRFSGQKNSKPFDDIEAAKEWLVET